MRLLALGALGLTGCIGVPSPLAPGLEGSLGVPQSGVHTAPVELPAKGPGFLRYRPKSPHYWGNPRLITALGDAAKSVHEAFPQSPPLYIGDISSKTGGKIPGHRSHRTGRDADLLLYVTTPSGAPIRSPGFVSLDTDGLGKVNGTEDWIRLDVERNWHLVKSLVEHPQIGVQWLFVSRGIEALLVDYAIARGEDPELVWHAETVMLQPADSTPHADHFHIRIACAPDEAVRGCMGGGPYWQWLPGLPVLAPGGLDEIARDDPLDLERLADSAPEHGDDA